MQHIYVTTITDEADFGCKVDIKAFRDRASAEAWGEARIKDWTAKDLQAGESIECICYSAGTERVPMDD